MVCAILSIFRGVWKYKIQRGFQQCWKAHHSEDNIIKDLLETNVRQRGNIGGSSVKFGRRIRELERIYGVRNGSANPKGTEIGVSSSNGTSRGMTQQDLANQFGIDINTLKRAKSLTTLPSEIQDLIGQGRFPKWESACYFCSWNPILEFHAAV